MATNGKSLLSNTNVIIPKTRSEWIIRNNNSNYEASFDNISNLIQSGVIYEGTHSKSGNVHIISGLPDLLFLSFRFKATSNYIDGDIFSINNINYTVRIGNIKFNTGSVVEADLDKNNKNVYIKIKPPIDRPYRPTDLPQFTYSGQYQTLTDGDLGWKIRFKSSGNFKLIDPETITIDVFLVGGGGGGGTGYIVDAAGGGGGGYTKTIKKISLKSNVNYEILIAEGGKGGVKKNDQYSQNNGKPGGLSSFNKNTVNGGEPGKSMEYGGAGGSGGASAYCTGRANDSPGFDGGTDGGNGGHSGGRGQGTTTKEFGESAGQPYAGGGGSGGSAAKNIANPAPRGGKGGVFSGGDGGNGYSYEDIQGHGILTFGDNSSPPNYGGGGGGGGGGSAWNYPSGGVNQGGNGGSGVVIIRNSR